MTLWLIVIVVFMDILRCNIKVSGLWPPEKRFDKKTSRLRRPPMHTYVAYTYKLFSSVSFWSERRSHIPHLPTYTHVVTTRMWKDLAGLPTFLLHAGKRNGGMGEEKNGCKTSIFLSFNRSLSRSQGETWQFFNVHVLRTMKDVQMFVTFSKATFMYQLQNHNTYCSIHNHHDYHDYE